MSLFRVSSRALLLLIPVALMGCDKKSTGGRSVSSVIDIPVSTADPDLDLDTGDSDPTDNPGDSSGGGSGGGGAGGGGGGSPGGGGPGGGGRGAPVPEPSTLILLGSGMAALGWARRRKAGR